MSLLRKCLGNQLSGSKCNLRLKAIDGIARNLDSARVGRWLVEERHELTLLNVEIQTKPLNVIELHNAKITLGLPSGKGEEPFQLIPKRKVRIHCWRDAPFHPPRISGQAVSLLPKCHRWTLADNIKIELSVSCRRLWLSSREFIGLLHCLHLKETAPP